MVSWLERLSIRAKIVLLTLAILVPAAGALAWFLAADLRHAREAADARVSLLASQAATDLERFLGQARDTLEHLAARPRVQALDASDCDPLIAEWVTLNPEFTALVLLDLRGRSICAYGSKPHPRIDFGLSPWFEQVLRRQGFVAGDAMLWPVTGRWAAVLCQPVHDAAGSTIGVLALPVDLITLSALLLAQVPAEAVVTVFDRERAVLLRSSAAPAHIGTRPDGSPANAPPDLRNGLFAASDSEGTLRRFAIHTVPGVDWSVIAGVPEAAVIAQYQATLQRTLGAGLVASLLALALAWRLSDAIVRPIAGLARAAAEVSAGQRANRASLDGPPEIVLLARQFNQMLDTRDLGEAALSESEARYRLLVDRSAGAICICRAGMLCYVNQAAIEIFGARCAQDLLGMSLLDRVHPDHRQPTLERCLLDAAGHAGAEPKIDLVMVKLDGSPVEVEARGSPVEFGGMPSMVVSIRDITARKRTEYALRDSEAELRRLLTLLPEAVIVNRDNRISFVNEAAQRLLGADEAALLGRSSIELFGPGSVAVDKGRIQALNLSTSAAPAIEEKVLRADGETRIVETTATLIEDRGATSILAVMRDVTDLKQAQASLLDSHGGLQRLLAAQDSVQENERKRIARELHDDLQQTLAAIRIDLGVIGARLPTDPAGAASLLTEVDAHAEAAIASTRRIVNDLRPQMLEELGLVAALEVMAGQLSQRAGMDCQVVAQREAGQALLESPAVTTCLYRVAQEALNNVLKHSQASRVQLHLSRLADGRVTLRISDNGRGIGAGERQELEAFGLLGMAERVRAVGGVLRLDSPPGAGTTVEVIVPVASRLPLLPDMANPARASAPQGQRDHDPGAVAIEGRMLQGVIDALAGHVAVLDADGVIVLVNRAWREFAERNGDPGMRGCGPGTNYLEVCRRGALGDKGVQRVLEGLNAVLDRSRGYFVSEYPCDAPGEQRWFRLHAAPMADGRALVTHFNLTEWVDPVRKRESGQRNS